MQHIHFPDAWSLGEELSTEFSTGSLEIAAQKKQVRAMAVVKNWPDPVLYVDDGVTDMIDVGERPQGEQLLADIRTGKIDAVIVAALDRIGRRAIYILNFIDDTKDNVLVVSCKESIDTSTPTGKFLLTIMAGIAELERDTISARTKAALDARGQSIGVRGGLPPYGYRYEGKDVLINGLEAEVVREVYELRAQGLTLRAIALRTPLSFNAVKNVLDREEVYRGGKRGESEHTWPVILEKVPQMA